MRRPRMRKPPARRLQEVNARVVDNVKQPVPMLRPELHSKRKGNNPRLLPVMNRRHVAVAARKAS